MAMTILETVVEFNSKKVVDYSSTELAGWYMALTTFKTCASGADVRKAVVKALKKATKELKRRNLM